MREPNPDRMLERMSVLQYNEWMAYERAFGPIDGTWSNEMLAELNELIQINNQLTGASVTKKGQKNPAGKFQRIHRPWQRIEDEDELEDYDEDDDEVESPGPELSEAEKIRRFDFDVFGDRASQTVVKLGEDGE